MESPLTSSASLRGTLRTRYDTLRTQASLRTIRADLGLSRSSASSSSSADCTRSVVEISKLLNKALTRLDEQAETISALQSVVTSVHVAAYDQNVVTGAIHGLRAGGAVRQRRGGVRWLNTIADAPWWTLCDR